MFGDNLTQAGRILLRDRHMALGRQAELRGDTNLANFHKDWVRRLNDALPANKRTGE